MLEKREPTVGEMGERELIRRFIVPLLSKERGNPLLDDCAVIDVGTSDPLLLSIDQGPTRSFLEILGVGSPADIGHFHVTMNASDIAAMGGIPLGMLMVLALKGDETTDYVAHFLTGVHEAMDQYGIRLWGGDTKQAPVRSTTISIVGKAHKAGPLMRKGAQLGDEIYVTPNKIGSALRSYILGARNKTLVERPRAQLAFGQELSAAKIATSCMDMSDGVVATAEQLGQINEATFALDIDALPCVDPPSPDQSNRWRDLIMNVGGDFGLMFTTAPRNGSRARRLGAQLVGTVIQSTGDWINKSTLHKQGVRVRAWEQFKTTEPISNEIRSFV